VCSSDLGDFLFFFICLYHINEDLFLPGIFWFL
jgi:hypothetical protein